MFHALLSFADFFKINFFKNIFLITIRVSNSLDPDQDSQNMVLNCVQTHCKNYPQTTKIAASKERVKFCLGAH